MSHRSHSRNAYDRYDEDLDYSRTERTHASSSRHSQSRYLSSPVPSAHYTTQPTPTELVHIPKPTWPAAGSTPFALGSANTHNHTHREGADYAAHEDEHAHARGGFIDANEISHCRLEGEDSHAYSGCLIVSDRPVKAPFREARNRIAGVTTAADRATLDCGPRILSEAALRVMAEIEGVRAGRR